jgi:phosphoribosylanthranilate isomerase
MTHDAPFSPSGSKAAAAFSGVSLPGPGEDPSHHNHDHQQPVRVRVKICGLTSAADAEAAIHAGADALGFNTWSGSRRFLDLARAGDWIAGLPVFVTKVALCVNAPLSTASAFAALPFIDVVQLHGDEDRDYCLQLAGVSGRPLIRAVRLESFEQSAGFGQWGTRHVLIDAAVAGEYGGTGARLDLELAARTVQHCHGLCLTLAGGLDPDNVAEAIRRVRPYAVDVASGVESAPGRKDVSKMRAFVQAVAEASR